MKDFIVVNLLTEQFAKISANNLREAKRKACFLAIDLGLDHAENEIAYWIEKQAYLSVQGFTELKAVESVEVAQEIEIENITPNSKITLEQVREAIAKKQDLCNKLNMQSEPVTDTVRFQQLRNAYYYAKQDLDQLNNRIMNYLLTGEW